MVRILFLILIVMSSVAFAQTAKNPKAIKFAEFERATNGFVKMKMDAFLIELSNNPNAQVYIINYGTAREIASRETQLRNAINFYRSDSARITLVRGGFWKVVKTELWIVPSGADVPQPKTTAEKVDEFGKTTNRDIRLRIGNLFAELKKNLNHRGYIVEYGSDKDVLVREKQIRRYISLRRYELSRITFVRSGFSNEIKTELWIIPLDVKKKS